MIRQNFRNQIYQYRILYFSGIAALLGSIVYSIYYDEWILLFCSYIWARFVGLMGNQIAQHKYFTHHAFETTPSKHKFLLFFSILGGEGSPISWAIHHRHHHGYADSKLDLHSPHESLVLSSLTWPIKSEKWWLHEKQVRTVPKDLFRDKWVKTADQHYYKIWIALVTVSLLIDWRFCLFFILAPVGHSYITGAISNFLGHWKIPGSYRNFETDDQTHNNKILSIYLLGEGLHNNHHHDPKKYNTAMYPGELDFGGMLIEKFFVQK